MKIEGPQGTGGVVQVLTGHLIAYLARAEYLGVKAEVVTVPIIKPELVIAGTIGLVVAATERESHAQGLCPLLDGVHGLAGGAGVNFVAVTETAPSA